MGYTGAVTSSQNGERDMRVVAGESKDTAEKSGKERNNGQKVQERGEGERV
jgi:hypothetical protein